MSKAKVIVNYRPTSSGECPFWTIYTMCAITCEHTCVKLNKDGTKSNRKCPHIMTIDEYKENERELEAIDRKYRYQSTGRD